MKIVLGMMVLAGSMTFQLGCESNKKSELKPENNSPETSVSDIKNNEKIEVGVSILEKNSGLSLTTTATAYTVRVEGCVSGYTTEVTSDRFFIYKHDRDCKAKLLSFTLNDGSQFVPVVGSDFPNYATNDEATFEKVGDASRKLKLKYELALPSVIQPISVISFSFSEVSRGADNSTGGQATIDTFTQVIGDEAPQFDIPYIEMTGIDASGRAELSIALECKNPATGLKPELYCGTVRMLDIVPTLAPYPAHGGELTKAELETLSAYAPLAVWENFLFAQNELFINGGFELGNTSTQKYVFGRPEMGAPGNNLNVLILKNGDSYQYFKIDTNLVTW